MLSLIEIIGKRNRIDLYIILHNGTYYSRVKMVKFIQNSHIIQKFLIMKLFIDNG